MSLLKPHLGELLDRIGTLSMKIEESRIRDGEPAQHFVKERDEVTAFLHFTAFLHEDPVVYVDRLVWAMMLGTVLGRMWELNKQARLDDKISLRYIHTFNDARAELMRRLGEAWTGEPLPKDKVY